MGHKYQASACLFPLAFALFMAPILLYKNMIFLPLSFRGLPLFTAVFLQCSWFKSAFPTQSPFLKFNILMTKHSEILAIWYLEMNGSFYSGSYTLVCCNVSVSFHIFICIFLTPSTIRIDCNALISSPLQILSFRTLLGGVQVISRDVWKK